MGETLEISVASTGAGDADGSFSQVGGSMRQNVIAKARRAASGSDAVPYDQALRGSVLFHYPSHLIELLSSSLSTWLGADARILDIGIYIRRYKPGRRCLFELELLIGSRAGNPRERRRLIGKIFPNDRGAKVYETLNQLWSHGFDTGPLNVPQPLAYDSDWQLLLMSWAKGESLDQLLLNQSDVSKAIIGSAEWLLKLHTCGVNEGRCNDLNRYVNKLRQWQRYLKVVYPEAEPLFARILGRLEAQGGALSGWSSVPTHHDYSPDHLIIDNNQITGVDFDEFCQFDPLFDVAHFAAHLRYLGLTRFGALNQFDRQIDLFQNTYKAHAKDYSVTRVRLYTVIAYLKLVYINAFNRRTQDWKQVVATLLHESQQIV